MRRRMLFEGAISTIPVQDVPAHPSYEEIGVAIELKSRSCGRVPEPHGSYNVLGSRGVPQKEGAKQGD
jgi:hypothetical protein